MDCMSIVMFQTMDSVYATFTLMILSALLHLSLARCDFFFCYIILSVSITCCIETVKDDVIRSYQRLEKYLREKNKKRQLSQTARVVYADAIDFVGTGSCKL